jgi:hypothetical protein
MSDKPATMGWFSDGRWCLFWLPVADHAGFPLLVTEPLARETLLQHGAGRNVLLVATLKESTPSLMHYTSQPGEGYKAVILRRYVDRLTAECEKAGAQLGLFFGRRIDDHQFCSLLGRRNGLTVGLIMGQAHDGQGRGLWEWDGT